MGVNDTEDSLEPVDYTGYVEDMVRISYDTAFLTPPPSKPPEPRQQNREEFEEKVEQEIRKRKQVMAGLDVEIQELKDLINK